MSQLRKPDAAPLLPYTAQVFAAASHKPSVLGVKIFVAAEAVTLATLLVAVWMTSAAGSRDGLGAPGFGSTFSASTLTAALVASSGLMFLFRRRRRLACAAAAVLGLAFALLTIFEWRGAAQSGLVLGGSRSADSFYLVTAFHWIHIAAGAAVLLAAARGDVRAPQFAALSWYWHTVVAAWLPIAATFYWLT